MWHRNDTINKNRATALSFPLDYTNRCAASNRWFRSDGLDQQFLSFKHVVSDEATCSERRGGLITLFTE